MKHAKTAHDEKRREMTSRFINDYLLYCKVLQNAAAGADDNQDDARYSDAATPMHSSQHPADFNWHPLLPGQIRLLSQPDSLCYVLILRQWDQATYLVVPFSRFSLPATDEEILLSHTRTEYLSVLQLWNARTLHPLFLRRSWLVDTLDEHELALARNALAYVLTGEGDCDQFMMRMGLPVYRSFDPRLDYKEKALARFAAIDAADFDWTEQCETFSEESVWNVTTNTTSVENAAVHDATILLPTFSPKKYPRLFFKPVPLAAAGDENRSPCWVFDTPTNKLLQALREGVELPQPEANDNPPRARFCLPDFAPEPANPDNVLLWNLADLKLPPGSYDALFVHSQKRVLLGSGYALVNDDGKYVSFTDWLSTDNPPVSSPADLTIFICQEARI